MTMSKEALYDWSGLNVSLFKAVNGLGSAGLYDKAMLAITRLGDHSILPYVLAVLLAYVGITYTNRKLEKKGGNKYFLAMWLGIFLVLGTGLVASHMSVSFMKDYFAYDRPYVALGENAVRHIEPAREEAYGHRSFPSGHVAFITLVVMSLWPALGGKARVFGLALIAAVAWSRMALGVHFPADLLGGFLLVLAEVLAIRAVLYRLLYKMFGLQC